jgi:hypothetical protein
MSPVDPKLTLLNAAEGPKLTARGSFDHKFASLHGQRPNTSPNNSVIARHDRSSARAS